MFKRSKLRDILTKHQQDLPLDAVDKLKKHNAIAASRSVSGSGSGNDDKMHVECIEGADGGVPPATGQGRVTPVEYFTPSQSDFNYVKPNEHMDYGQLETFQRAVSPILVMGQCFALMPVMGVRHPNPRHLRFSLVSLQALFTLFFLVASSIFTLSMLKHLLKIGVDAKNIVGVVFFSCVQASCVLFLSLAKRWPHVMRFWTRTEVVFTRKPYETPKRNLAKRVRMSAVAIVVLSIVEHGLYLASAVTSQSRKLHICAAQRNTTATFNFSTYIRLNYDYVLQMLPFSNYLGIYVLILNGCCTFVWNYMDLFIMVVSMGIAYRFEQITVRINKLADKDVHESVFIEIREHYVKLCELLECVDENLSGIILLSCMNNLYFVCYQLLNIFNKLRWPINYIYFWYSLLYLIGRTAFVFLTAASINDESRGGLSVLRRVPSKTWCVEVERLIFEMTTHTVALSGKKFYFLTRRLLFGMAGTIVTYELVLLQFDEPTRSKGLPDLCA